MTLFDQLVDEALENRSSHAILRNVVEKELLHHDILRTLKEYNLLNHLTFIGGTCLRMCYGGIRLSEDLDFTGGGDFSKHSLTSMSVFLVEMIQNKYGFKVKINEPIKDESNVDTWKIIIETRPNRKDLPAQRINIDICAVPSHEIIPMALLNPYGVDMGTSGLIIRAQSREEIYVDKIIAFALRPNLIKYRDIWDITWLHQQAINPKIELLPLKINDRKLSGKFFLQQYQDRASQLENKFDIMNKEFAQEMFRFLPTDQVEKINIKEFCSFSVYLLKDLERKLVNLFKV